MRVPSLPADFTPSQQGRQSAKCAFFLLFSLLLTKQKTKTKQKSYVQASVFQIIQFFK